MKMWCGSKDAKPHTGSDDHCGTVRKRAERPAIICGADHLPQQRITQPVGLDGIYGSRGRTPHRNQYPDGGTVKTYTNPGDVVLDNTMGSGTTGVVCMNTGRGFIGIELTILLPDRAKITHRSRCRYRTTSMNDQLPPRRPPDVMRDMSDGSGPEPSQARHIQPSAHTTAR